MTSILSMPRVSATVRRSSANARTFSYWIRGRRPDAWPVDSDQPDADCLRILAGLRGDLPSRSGVPCSQKTARPCGSPNSAKPQLPIVADCDVALELGTGNRTLCHYRSVTRTSRTRFRLGNCAACLATISQPLTPSVMHAAYNAVNPADGSALCRSSMPTDMSPRTHRWRSRPSSAGRTTSRRAPTAGRG